MAEPERTCIGCRTRAPQTSLIRVAWDNATGMLVVDHARRIPGRGAYLHPRCVARASRVLGRALRRQLDSGEVARVLGALGQIVPPA